MLEINVVDIGKAPEQAKALAPCKPVKLTVRAVEQRPVDVLPVDMRLGSDRIADASGVVDVARPFQARIADEVHLQTFR